MDKLWNRFWKKVQVTPEGHWLWTGGLYPNGYGYFTVSTKPRKQALAHRWLYEQVIGPIPEGLDLDHIMICRVGNCVNWNHLEPVTRSVNAQRREKARRLGMPPYAIARKRTGLHGRDKTHCKRGHPFNEENTVIYNGRRHCRACRLIRSRERLVTPAARADSSRQDRARQLRKTPLHGRDKKYCKRGHWFTEANTYIHQGKRICRACKPIQERERRKDPEYLQQKLKKAAQKQYDLRIRRRGGLPQIMPAARTHCPAGHPYAGDNLYIRPLDGSRRCRTCTKQRQAARSKGGLCLPI